MQKFLYLPLFFLILSCKNTSENSTSETANTTIETESKSINIRVPDEEDGGEMLLGNINFNGLQEAPFNDWFQTNQKEHVLDTTAIDSLEPLLKNVSIKVFMGTWCEDSQREIPALHKILEAVHFKNNYLEMVAVTHDKDTPNGLEKDYELEYVPTIIFFKNGAEINRIVEYPQESLEKDMLKILKELPYTPAYAE
ncbi:MAG TPA: thioredoxin family protein [Flavobacteriaceae bacterium]|nr:thioredoxin family protein [Flavobacteriaceae bacterium]HPF12063.1 thioredoxin family protein [Flavobacteriaceae bacterium]HQU21506.1 thioredoxin family protein [Flavobacteriaceae bacterium]HQU65656.1 thioredoxin family protein [Flavobacteriaceae bacterium]HRW44839.1 thioredoxin family protein [Flavobacteriaceae bacterium]